MAGLTSGQRIAALLSRLPTEAVEVATMISESGPIELIDGLMLLPKAILGELVGIKDHLGPELSAVIDELAVVAAGAENMVTIAVRDRDFVRVADALRYEWSVFLTALLGFLDPDSEHQLDTLEVGASQSAEELYESNLEALGTRYPTMVSQLRAAWDGRDQERYQIDEGPTGIRSPRINNQRMWSITSPSADAMHIAKHHVGDANQEHWDCAGTWGIAGPIAHDVLSAEMEAPRIFVRPNLEAFG